MRTHFSKRELKIVNEIANPVFTLMKKLLIKEMRKVPENQPINVNFYMDLISASLISVDTNIFLMARNLFEKAAGKKMDMVHFLYHHINNMLQILNEEERQRLMEKMN